MAKQFNAPTKLPKMTGTSFSEVNEFLAKIDPEGAILEDYKEIDPWEWIHSGNYLLNAQLSGSLLKGYANNKTYCIGGDPKTGKSYLIYNAIREAQGKGYIPFFFETENAPDRERMRNQMIDMKRARITQPETVEEIIITLTKLTETLLVKKRAKEEIPKFLVVIDSISTLNSQKQYDDALEGKSAKDMGGIAKSMKQLFNMMVIRCGKLGIPFLTTAHVYPHQEGNFIEKKMSGGMGAIYMSSGILLLRKFFEKDDDTKERTGIRVRSDVVESRFAKHINIDFFIDFTKGMNAYTGLQNYVSWETCGIDKGKFVDFVDFGYEWVFKKLVTKETIAGFKFTAKDLAKHLSKGKAEFLSEQIDANLEHGIIELAPEANTYVFSKKAVKSFKKDGDKEVYAPLVDLVGVVNQKAGQYIVKHLRSVVKTPAEFFTSKVFTVEVLKQLDEKVIKPKFEYGDKNVVGPIVNKDGAPTVVVGDDVDELYALAESGSAKSSEKKK